jgi:long-chain acyl-CoA synthetase
MPCPLCNSQRQLSRVPPGEHEKNKRNERVRVAGFFDNARERPDEVAVVDGDHCLTWARFADRVDRCAHVLRDAGVGVGDHVAMVMGNRSEFLEVLCACLETGAVLTPVNWHFQPDEAAYVVENCDARVLVVDARYVPAGKRCAELPGVRRALVTSGADECGLERYEDALAAAPDDPIGVDGPAGGVMLYTSGTTGRPKGVRRELVAGATARTMVAGMAFMGELLGADTSRPHLVTGPLYHAAPIGFSQMAFHGGAPLVLMHQWTPEATLELMTRWDVATTHLVPTMFTRLLRLPEQVRAAFDPSGLRLVLHGAAPCPVPVKEAMIEWWGPVITEYYGATEGGLTLIRAQEWLERKGSVGRPLPNYTVEIRDDDGRQLPVGETGTVWFRSTTGPATFEYYKDDAKTKEAHLEPGVFTLGDVGRVDDEGYVWLTDRKNDMIIAGGVNIYPAEVEQVLVTHPAVADAAVFGIPDEEWGESVKAAVELLQGHVPSAELERELIDFCRARLAHYKCPRSIDFEERLPRHPTGKLYKRLLRERYWQGAGKLI